VAGANSPDVVDDAVLFRVVNCLTVTNTARGDIHAPWAASEAAAGGRRHIGRPTPKLVTVGPYTRGDCVVYPEHTS
jgi:hypothetical protein